MSTIPATAWRADYSNGYVDYYPARSAAEAAAASAAQYPDTEIISLERMTVWGLLAESYGDEEWTTTLKGVVDTEHPRLPRQTCGHDWLVLAFTVGIDQTGRIVPEAIAHFRILQQRWAGLDSVRFDGGRVSLNANGAAPADLINVLESAMAGELVGPPIEDVRAELGLGRNTFVRVAVSELLDDGTDRWRVIEVPAEVIGEVDMEPDVVGKHLQGDWNSDVILLDPLPGFRVGCATFSQYSGVEADEARRGHWGCAHHLFRPAY
ncbi:hypothetical protein [Nocardia sp. CY41]|uniref:hypothetical protein n=1 Tax=Nocardia sp. CY41 TaxID=2608686 RepID=UPI0013578AE8|nr:hypothetical protein [Nocardia sp. CY41]